jgi:regulator of sigma D
MDVQIDVYMHVCVHRWIHKKEEVLLAYTSYVSIN